MTQTHDDLTEDQFARVQMGVQMLVEHLVKVEGLPLPGILAAVHAEILGAIASVYGGDVAGQCAQVAVAKMAGLPRHDEEGAHASLATMPPRGRA